MKSFKGNVLSWDVSDGVIELALHRHPAERVTACSFRPVTAPHFKCAKRPQKETQVPSTLAVGG
jgi:hypothetical protein